MVLIAKADFEKAKRLYPSTSFDDAAWVAIFDTNPDAMWSIVGDIYDAVMAEAEKDAGVRRMGRRPRREGVSLDEVWAVVFPPRYTQESFVVALRGLLAGRSQRQFAMKIPCNQSTLSRLLSGDMKPDMSMLEGIAKAAKVNPAYFREWRAMWLGALLTRVYLDRPNLSITAIEKVRSLTPAAA